MTFNNRGSASFFKILLSDSIDRLPLPPAFAKKYLETSKIKKQIVVLKIKKGVKGTVRYSKIKDKYYFKDGWLKFMKNNRLKMGVFLVFWLLSPSPTLVFQVSVYEPNGCLKQPTTLNNAIVIEETSYDDSLENMQHKKMTMVFQKSYSRVMLLQRSFVKATGINGYRNVQLMNDEGKTWNAKVANYSYGISYQHITRLGAGWHDFRKDNKIEIGDTCEFYHVKSNLLRVRVLTAEKGNMR